MSLENFQAAATLIPVLGASAQVLVASGYRATSERGVRLLCAVSVGTSVLQLELLLVKSRVKKQKGPLHNIHRC